MFSSAYSIYILYMCVVPFMFDLLYIYIMLYYIMLLHLYFYYISSYSTLFKNILILLHYYSYYYYYYYYYIINVLYFMYRLMQDTAPCRRYMFNAYVNEYILYVHIYEFKT